MERSHAQHHSELGKSAEESPNHLLITDDFSHKLRALPSSLHEHIYGHFTADSAKQALANYSTGEAEPDEDLLLA